MASIAVIMSIYRNDKLDFVRESVNSILNQSISLLDLFVQFDGPVDKEIENYFEVLSDKRITINKSNTNKGLANSLNNLLVHVFKKDYTYIARMDADDISFANRMEKQILFLEENPHVDCVGTWAIEINNDGKEYFKKKMPATHDECFKMFQKRDCLIHPTVTFRRSYFEKAGLYPEDTYFGEDTMMWAKGFKNGCIFANVPEYLLKFRLDSHFFSRRRGWKHAKSILNLRLKINKMLGFSLKSDIYAFLYAIVKMMPTQVLDKIYRIYR